MKECKTYKAKLTSHEGGQIDKFGFEGTSKFTKPRTESLFFNQNNMKSISWTEQLIARRYELRNSIVEVGFKTFFLSLFLLKEKMVRRCIHNECVIYYVNEYFINKFEYLLINILID